MALTWLDWVWIALYFALNAAVGFYYRTRAGKSVDEFFLSGRNVPWWLAGTSMVATTFAADTPLWVTGQVVRHGGLAMPLQIRRRCAHDAPVLQQQTSVDTRVGDLAEPDAEVEAAHRANLDPLQRLHDHG